MRIVVFGIHPDDIELCCGGTVIRATGDGHEVTLVDLSDGSASSNGTTEERRAEASRAAAIMGVKQRINLGLPDTAIQSQNLEQTRKVVACIRERRPEIVLIPSSDDPHPDHASGGVLIQRALYLSGIHGYDTGQEAWRPANALVYPGRVEFEPHIVVDISAVNDQKLRAIGAHKSQFGAGARNTPINSPNFLPAVEARGRTYGLKIGVPFGEGFRLLNPMALPDFGALV